MSTYKHMCIQVHKKVKNEAHTLATCVWLKDNFQGIFGIKVENCVYLVYTWLENIEQMCTYVHTYVWEN